MANTILFNKNINSKSVQLNVLLNESIKKALALSDISTNDHFLGNSDSTIYHHLLALHDVIKNVKTYADLIHSGSN